MLTNQTETKEESLKTNANSRTDRLFSTPMNEPDILPLLVWTEMSFADQEPLTAAGERSKTERKDVSVSLASFSVSESDQKLTIRCLDHDSLRLDLRLPFERLVRSNSPVGRVKRDVARSDGRFLEVDLGVGGSEDE